MCRKAAGRRHPTLTLPDVADELARSKGTDEQPIADELARAKGAERTAIADELCKGERAQREQLSPMSFASSNGKQG